MSSSRTLGHNCKVTPSMAPTYAGLVFAFLTGAITVFIMCESKPRSWLPNWLAVYVENAGAIRTMAVHRSFVCQIENRVGMPISAFSAAIPTIIPGAYARACWPMLVKFCNMFSLILDCQSGNRDEETQNLQWPVDFPWKQSDRTKLDMMRFPCKRIGRRPWDF